MKGSARVGAVRVRVRGKAWGEGWLPAGSHSGASEMGAKIQFVAPAVPSERELSDQIERIAAGSGFRSSEILRHLLHYLAKRAIEAPTEPVRVKDIAAEVFGRSHDFDSQTDSIVRVHTGRLRSRLAEYYSREGAEDIIVVTIPKGSYSLLAAYRHEIPAPAPARERLEPPDLLDRPGLLPEKVPPAGLAGWAPRRRWAVLALLAIATAGVAFYAGSLVRKPQARAMSPALERFWRPFVAGEGAPLVVFSNFQLVGSFEAGLRDADGRAPEGIPVIDTYTSMGEVMGVFEIARIMSMFQKPIRPKRSALLTWDEAKDSDLIFVGGPLAQTPLRDTPIFHDFEFRNRMSGMPGPSGVVVNLHPLPGEAPIYYGPKTRPFQFDYAVVALSPSTGAGRRTLALAGITEYGTQAAAEFVTREQHVSALLARLHVQPGRPAPWFEALLRTTITGGVPTQIDLVSVHQPQ